MNERKPTAVIEITSNQIKLLIGYLSNGKVYVLYSTTKEIKNVIDAGVIKNMDALVSALKTFTRIEDKEKLLRFNIKEIVLILPSLGFNSFIIDKTTNIINPNGVIEREDVENMVRSIQSEPLPNNNDVIVDVIPESFMLDQNRLFKNIPEGERSTSLTARSHIYTLNSNMNDAYRYACEAAGFKIRRTVIAPLATAELFESYKIDDLKNGYYLVDIGSTITTVSMVYQSSVFLSNYFLKGGNDITDDVMKNFRTSIDDAEKLKRRYGYSNLGSFNPPIYKRQLTEEQSVTYNANQLNDLIREDLDEFITDLKNTINIILNNYPENSKPRYLKLPIVLTGGGSRLCGLVEYMQETMPEYGKIMTIVPSSIGTRNQRFSNCLGAIKFVNTYRGALQETKARVTGINRVGEQPKRNVSSGVIGREEL